MQQNQLPFPDRLRGYKCPCCGLFVKEYERSYNANMGFIIYNLYLQEKFEWVHIEKWIQENKFPRCGDFSYNVFYGLLEKMVGDRPDTSSRNGYYRLTAYGVLFAENKVEVWSKFRIFDGKFQGFVETGKNAKKINIKQAAKNKFSYDTLMGNL